MLQPYLKIWDRDLIYGRAVKAVSLPGVRCPWRHRCVVDLRQRLNTIIEAYVTLPTYM